MGGRYIAVDGPIAVGKSAVVEALRVKLNARTHLDPPNPFLRSFYDDMGKYAFQVQLYFLLSRFQQQREIAQGDLFSSAVICDYLFQKDRLFASQTLEANEYLLYDKAYEMLQGTIATPDVVVYLQADVDTLIERLSAKDEGFALLMPEAYLAQIVDAYQEFFFRYADAPVIVCNTVKHDFARNEEHLSLLLRKVSEVRSGVHFLNPAE